MTREDLKRTASELVYEDESFLEKLGSRLKKEDAVRRTLKRMESAAMKIAGRLTLDAGSASMIRGEVRKLKEAALKR